MRRVLKRIGIGLGVLLGVLVILVIVLAIIGTLRFTKTYHVQAEAIPIPTDAVSLARGEYLAKFICVECHGEDLSGDVVFDEAVIVSINAPNLTTGEGGMGHHDDDELILAIRHGLTENGKPLLIMPADVFIEWSAEDLGAVIAYLRTIPPVDHDVPETRVSIIGRALLPLGVFGNPFPAEYIDHNQPFPAMPTIGVNPEYGAYLARAFGCTMCHGDNLAGGVTPESAGPGEIPKSPNLTPAGDLAVWSEADFIQTLRTGTTPEGEKINNDHMPWEMYSRASDEDLQALWSYLQTLPATN
jgi:mono/diheme cytochrome c family protein